jgi:RNA-splicing ligase RtcB
MTYQQLATDTATPVLSWAGHDLASAETKMAKNTYTLDDLIAQTQGVECRKDTELLDEIPAAYKSIDTVMANQSDLVEVVATLKQVVCIKG